MAPQKPNNRYNAVNSNGIRGGKIQKQRKKHKVVLENANNKDNGKPDMVMSFHANPPPGFTFIPAGNTQLTQALKMFAKRAGKQIMAVSATQHAQRHELSREVHRIGYHFPTEVIDQVCAHYGIRLDSSGRLIGEHDSDQLFMKIQQKGEVVLNETIRDQVTINTEAKEIIRDLFPKIPDNDLFQIIKTAFQLGDNKVGTAEEIPLVRRAQLSVVAHIRHSYTNYDRLLRQLPYNEARHSVEKPTLKKLVEWRGDEHDKTEESRKAVDDAVREVVVLSDEESSESEIEEGQVLENDDLKVESVPARKPARPQIITEHRPVSPGEQSSNEEAPKGYRYVPRPPRRTLVPQAHPETLQRQQQSRYALWEQVRDEYRTGVPVPAAPQVISRMPLDASTYDRYEPATREVHYEPIPPRYVVEQPPPVRVLRQPGPPALFRGADGKLYERMLPRAAESSAPLRRIRTPPTDQAFMAHSSSRRSASPGSLRPQYHRRTPSMNDDGTIMQSIEPPDSAYRSPAGRQYGFDPPTSHVDSGRRAVEHRHNLIDLTNSAEQATQRMHVSPPPSPYLQRYTRIDHDVEMSDENIPPRRRQLIELDQQLPTPSSSARSNMEYDPRYERYAQPVPPRAYGDRPAPQVLSQRKVYYEPIDDRQYHVQPARYVVPQPQHVSDDGRYYVVNDGRYQAVHAQAPPPPTAQYVPERRILLDADVPARDKQPPADSRFRTTYVQH